jgi:DNA-binding FadR family transcriptional regulator
VDEHEAIANAVLANDPAAARMAAEIHIGSVSTVVHSAAR